MYCEAVHGISSGHLLKLVLCMIFYVNLNEWVAIAWLYEFLGACRGTESLACINLSLILAVLDNIENTLSRWKSVCVHNHFKAFALHFFLQTAYSCMRTLTCVFDIVEVCFVFATSWGVGRSCFA